MIRLRIVRLFAAVAVLALTAFASSVASTSAPNLPPLTGLPAGKILVIGAVAHPESPPCRRCRHSTPKL